jgi:hypothetical protein
MKRIFTLLLVILACAQFATGQRDIQGPRVPPSTLNPYKGYVNISELTYGFGLALTDEEFAKYQFGFTTVNGYQINRFFIIGGGTGAMFYNDGFLLPLYLSSRFTWPTVNSPFSWYINADAGTLLNFEDFNGGTMLFVNPVAGVRYTLTRSVGLNLGVGLFVETGSAVNRDSFVNIKLGVIFIPQH